jgi:Domain of unknown function (DUF5134)
MTGPGWLTVAAAVLMLLISACCTARLVIWRLGGRAADPEADVLHVLMGVAMAGMLEPQIIPVPATLVRPVFAAGAAWFALRAGRLHTRRSATGPGRAERASERPAALRCSHPVPHAVECAAMLYMLLPSRPADSGPAMAMPGMISSAGVPPNPAAAFVLALFMLGYVLWTTDQLATLQRARAAGPALSAATGPSDAATGLAPAALAPRFAACAKIAMGIVMGYMLIAAL